MMIISRNTLECAASDYLGPDATPAHIVALVDAAEAAASMAAFDCLRALADGYRGARSEHVTRMSTAAR